MAVPTTNNLQLKKIHNIRNNNNFPYKYVCFSRTMKTVTCINIWPQITPKKTYHKKQQQRHHRT